MPSAVFPSPFASSTAPPSSLSSQHQAHARVSSRVRHSDLTCVTSVLPRLQISLMELTVAPQKQGLHLCSLFWLYEHTAQPQQGDTETTRTQPSQRCLQFPFPKKQHRAVKKALPTCTLLLSVVEHAVEITQISIHESDLSYFTAQYKRPST